MGLRSRRDERCVDVRVDIPIALVVDGSAEVVAITREVARGLRVLVRVCQAEQAAELAANFGAFALIVPWTASDADAALFDSLSRCSAAQVIALSTILPSPDALASAMRMALLFAAEPNDDRARSARS